ncbi:hypothetical protein ACFWPX_36270 [Nocardia sp. NPDC058518]
MQVGELVRIGATGVSQFRVLEVDDTGARIEPTLEGVSVVTAEKPTDMA